MKFVKWLWIVTLIVAPLLYFPEAAGDTEPPSETVIVRVYCGGAVDSSSISSEEQAKNIK